MIAQNGAMNGDGVHGHATPIFTGARLRQIREARGWSRFRLVVEIRDRFRTDGLGITEMGIVLIENGTTKEPRGTTLGMLRAVLPELVAPAA